MGISTRSTTIRIYMPSTGLATLAGIVSRFIPRPDTRCGRGAGNGRYRLSGDLAVRF